MRILTLYIEQGCMYKNRMDGLTIVESIVMPRENLSSGFAPCSARRCVLPLDFFFMKANHYNNFDCYILGNAKPAVATSNNLAEPDYDVIKMADILKLNTNLICFIISIKVGRFQIFRYQYVQNGKCILLTSKMAELNDDVTKMANILNLNENLLCIISLLILDHFDKSICLI